MNTEIATNRHGAPEQVLHLLADLGLEPARVTPLRGPDSPRPSASGYRIVLDGGASLKATLMIGARRAAEVERIVRALDHPAFPAVVARRGAVLLVEWVEGEVLDGSPVDGALLDACGALQAFVHGQAAPAEDTPSPSKVVGEITEKLRQGAAALVAAGVFSAPESQRILSLAARFAPDGCEVGLVHRDLCAANIVVRPGGAVCVIDNETMAVGSCEFDLARTWYRWPMTPGERERYFAAYAQRRAFGPFLAHFPFWAIAVLVDSAALRLAAPEAVRLVPQRRLGALLASLQGGTMNERLAFES